MEGEFKHALHDNVGPGDVRWGTVVFSRKSSGEPSCPLSTAEQHLKANS
jgi:hypothetical protein